MENIPKGWHIKYDPKPIPSRKFDFDFWHDDYDFCSESGGNGLCGHAESIDDARMQIQEIQE